MKVSIHFQEEGNILKGFITGEIDTFTAPTLRDELESTVISQYDAIELDLSNVNYMDSTGLGVFVAFYKKALREDSKLKLMNLTDRLVRLFEITGLSELMDIESEEKVKLKNG